MLRIFLLLLFGVVLVVFAGCDRHLANPSQSNPSQSNQAAVRAGEIGSHLPDFVTSDFNGRKLSSADLRGKVVLVDFWATWCTPCKKEMPGYQQLAARYGPRGFAVIGLKFDIMKDTEDPAQFAKKIGVRYPLAVATTEIKRKFGGIDGLPTTMLYDRQGILRQKIVGFEYTNVIEQEVKPLL